MSIKQDISEQYNSKPYSTKYFKPVWKVFMPWINQKVKNPWTPNLLGNLVQDIHELHNLL